MDVISISTSEAMDYINLVRAGVLATTVMTVLMYFGGFLTKKNLAVIHILGSMVTFRTQEGGNISYSFISLMSGFFIHFIVGILYGFVYYWLWENGIGIPNYLNSIIFGAGSGIVAILGWKIFLYIHPKPPSIPIKEYMVALFFTHIIFAIILIYVYLFLTRYPLPLI